MRDQLHCNHAAGEPHDVDRQTARHVGGELTNTRAAKYEKATSETTEYGTTNNTTSSIITKKRPWKFYIASIKQNKEKSDSVNNRDHTDMHAPPQTASWYGWLPNCNRLPPNLHTSPDCTAHPHTHDCFKHTPACHKQAIFTS
ncbi:hypothetical protein VPH35_058854 [Triticum aestivum]